MRAVLLLILSVAVVAHPGARVVADEATVKQMIGDYVKAFNAKDLETVMGFWSESGVHIDRNSGERTEGREAIQSDIAESFQNRPDTQLSGTVESLRQIKPDVVSINGQVTVSREKEDPVQVDYSAIVIEQDGKWMIDSIEELPVPQPLTSHDALAELDWLIGTWNDSDDDVTITNQFRWSENGAFLIRSFSAQLPEQELKQGTQVIGWDPRSLEIRSWTFNSDGSFGDAVWSKNGRDWLIKSGHTLPDGQAASGTYVLSRNGDDEITWKLIGHEVEGQPQPTSLEVTVFRVDEAPETDPAPAVSESSNE
ncbi:SgcJ/EcaC family oxidoreductase [Stieleria sp. TO1_6]|uniref:YybH family protein n=1 Tax=Stieleria tagensis TaxID=2956795 RepID=UPI00209B50E8|nr:SgcJ/EcaC family oxidoreductase [Stieleria tagensis]MCO8122816.1 SgcJ/EcaC family oxidoreductase [Stieleria tagensis]